MLFDGECVLCNRSVRWLASRDRDRRLRFLTLQSNAGRELLERAGLNADEMDSVVVCGEGRCDARSSALIRVGRVLRRPWAWFASAAAILPRWLLDPAYSALARSRYRLFGRLTECPVPTPAQRERILPPDNAVGAVTAAGFSLSTASPPPHR